ncbi:MAG: FtsX-like permease family protein [Tannerella sp.]|jgi:putative ABC transport system permease protein|nr:FtsX-like permease family protein [Tannerella sp.]
MEKFLWKGIIRDKSRSLLPVIVVATGVFFVIVMDGIAGGMMGSMIRMTASFQTGHLKVMTRACAENEEQQPLDLALLDVDRLMETLAARQPEVEWNARIRFGGLLDIPDGRGETRAQGPVSATAYDLLSPGSREIERTGLQKAVIAGRLIRANGEVLISADFADRFQVKPGDTLTFFGSTMYGSMSFTNLHVAGIVRFGTSALDRGAIIVDIVDARQLLDMDNAASEILGFLPGGEYDFKQAEAVKNSFNALYEGSDDEFAPVMLQLADQQSMGGTMAYIDRVMLIMIILLVLALSVVLWNTGVLGSIRRYSEFGVRLALGEGKGHIYRSLLTESIFIGGIGSCFGTVFGLAVSLYLHRYGIDYGEAIDSLAMMIDPVIRSSITPRMYYLGFIPGVASMLVGSALAGMAVYRRNTATLFKELE